ncbi:hypothetical protein FOCC_FOCC004822 [Frankliniella occidentalis]|nr:hypothetical protein FOCC_FOCC004822 [Frankliniella occidentalis]
MPDVPSPEVQMPEVQMPEVQMPEVQMPEVRQVIEQFLEQQFVYKEASHIVLIACYVPLFLVALFANCLVIFVVFKYHYMRSAEWLP